MESDENYGTDEFWKEQERIAEEESLMNRLSQNEEE